MDALTLIEGWEKLVTEACAVRLALARQNEAYFDELAEKPDVPLTELLVRDHGVTLATPLAKIVDLVDALRTKNREAERMFDTVHGEWKDYRWNLRGHPRVFDALFRARENALLPTTYTDQCFQHVTLDNMYDNQFWHMTGNALPRQPTLQAMASRVARMKATGRTGGATLAPTVAGLIREQDRSASTADRERELDRVREATRATLTEAVTQWTDDMQAHKAKMERIASFLRDDLNMERVVTTPLRQARVHIATVCSNTVRDIDETAAATVADVRDRVRATLDAMVQLGTGGNSSGQLFAGRVAQAVADARAMPIPAPAGDDADLMVAFRTLARWRYRKAAREHMRRVISHAADRVDAVCDQPIGREVPGNVLATVKEVTRDMRMIVQMIDSTDRAEPPLAWEHDQMTAQLAHVRERDARANLEVAFASITALLRRHHAAGTSPAVAHHELLASLTQHRDAAAFVAPQTNALSHRLKDAQRELNLASERIIRVQWPRDERGKKDDDADEEKKYDDEEEEEEEAEDMTSEKLVETLLDTLDAQLIPFLHAQEAEVRAHALPVLATLPPLPPGLFMDWHVTPTRLFRDFRDAYLAHPDLAEVVDRADADGGTRAMWAATLRAVLRQPDGTPKLDRLFHATHALVAILATSAHAR